MKLRTLPSIALAIALSGPPLMQACSGHQETTTTTTSSTAPDGTPTSTTTTTTTTDEPDSVVGATAHAVWVIVTFPFRLVGDAIELIV